MSLFIGICAVDTVAVNAKSPSDRQIVREYCHKHYKGYTIRYFTKWNDKVMSHRANRKIVYVEKMVSYSKDKYGYTKDAYYIKYNKRVKKGKKVISYCIYNPKNNSCDDVVAVVDNKILR
jgi:hypothetical protein